MEGWRDFADFSVHIDKDGAPTEIRTPARPTDDLIERRILRDAEHAVGVWLSYEYRWHEEDERWHRSVDLLSQQPSHKIIFIGDGCDPDTRLVIADLDANGTGVSWEKHEWYGKSCDNGGAWVSTHSGWRHRGLFTPGNSKGILWVETLPEPRPVSSRRNR